MPSRRMRMLRAPNCERAPKPRMEMRVSCEGFVRFATVTPGKSDSVCSTNVCVCPGFTLSGRRLVMLYGRSSGDRCTSRVTVTTGGRRRGNESWARAGETVSDAPARKTSSGRGERDRNTRKTRLGYDGVRAIYSAIHLPATSLSHLSQKRRFRSCSSLRRLAPPVEVRRSERLLNVVVVRKGQGLAIH